MMVVTSEELKTLSSPAFKHLQEFVRKLQLEEMKHEYIEAIYGTKALLIKDQPFDLKSGGQSRVYLSHNHFLLQYEYVKLMARIYLKLLEGKVKEYKLGVVDSIMSPILAGVMTGLSGNNIVVVKEKKTEHGVKEQVYGDATGEVVLIDDLTTTGNTLINSAKKIREKGGTVRYAVVSTCRNDEAKKNLAKEGIELLYIADLKEVLQLLEPALNEKEREIAVQEFWVG